MRSMMRVHRWVAASPYPVAVVIAYYCITDIGAPTDPLRVAVHAICGSLAFALLAVKFGLIG